MANQKWTRRELLKTSAATAGVLAVSGAGMRLAGAQGSDTIRVGVVGCGGRGSGAAMDCVNAAEGVEIVALADAFEDRLRGMKEKFNVADDHCFVGLDSYKPLMDLDDVNLVILAAPPGFRPHHYAEAVRQGKNVFMEKPVAVCPTGIQMVIESSKLAAEKGLGVVAGTQRRHQLEYVETMKRVHDGQIGELASAQCYWNQGGLWVSERRDGQPDVDWQVRNWLYFRWLSGDHICEQHIHNIDVINWAFNAHPVTMQGLGGRQFRTDPKYGDIYDNFGIEFIYPGGVRTMSTCRQIEGAAHRVSERIVGTKGWTDGAGRIVGENSWEYDGPRPNPYVQEHVDLIASIRKGEPLNEGIQVAESTLTAIMARESAYSRQQFNWSWFMSRDNLLNLLPADGLKLTDSLPVASAPKPGDYVIG